MSSRTFGFYVAGRFVTSVAIVFSGVLLLVILIDYIELSRRSAAFTHVGAGTVALTSLYRVPQIIERLLPFCVQIAAMTAFLNLSRRNELVVARAAGLSAWQFVAPAIIAAMLVGALATAAYNPLAARLSEQAKQLEVVIFGSRGTTVGGNWLRQRSDDGQSIMHALASRDEGETLSGVTVFVLDDAGSFRARIEAERARLGTGQWVLENAQVYTVTAPAQTRSEYILQTNLTPGQIRERFSSPDTVPFWQLPAHIERAERAGLVAAGYRLQFQTLLARPFLLAGMVLLAAAVSLRFFRMGGVNHMVLGGVAAGFLLYVLSKVTEDLSKAQLMYAVTAAWIPVAAGALTGIIALLFQEDG
jgi:lipopolysaccharide export system permease protein